MKAKRVETDPITAFYKLVDELWEKHATSDKHGYKDVMHDSGFQAACVELRDQANAQAQRLRAALALVMDYPDVRAYLGSQVSTVADQALVERRHGN